MKRRWAAVKITDDMLWEFAPQEERFLLHHFPQNPESVHVFSKEFERKMRALIRQEKRSPFLKVFILQSKRVAVVVFSATLIAFTAVMSIDALRVKFFKMVQNIFEKYSTISYEPVENTCIIETGFMEYEPTYIPSGYSLVNERVFTDSKHLTYKNSENDGIFFAQTLLEQADFDIDTEHAILQTIQINGEEAYYLPNETIELIIWDDGVYSFQVSAHLDKEELIKIAESIKIK